MNRDTPMSAEDDVRETPASLFDPLNAVHQFTLDVCATEKNAKVRLFYTEQDNGLTQRWDGRVWCNPPFSAIGAWVAKAWRECAAGRPALIWMLVPATRTEQPWWQKLVEPHRDGRPRLVSDYRLDTQFLPGRVHFLENGGPIYRKNKDGSLWINPKTGKPQRSSPKFGCVGLIWTKGN